jgi:hypothetical protein
MEKGRTGIGPVFRAKTRRGIDIAGSGDRTDRVHNDARWVHPLQPFGQSLYRGGSIGHETDATLSGHWRPSAIGMQQWIGSERGWTV